MANFCEYDLTIRGPLQDEFLNAISKDGEIIDWLEHFIPMPAEIKVIESPVRVFPTSEECLRFSRIYQPEPGMRNAITIQECEELKERFGAIDWHDWANKHWGTKWGTLENVLVSNNDKGLVITGRTAWGPPAESALAKISEMFPALEFDLRYYERGMAFQGQITFSAGKIKISRRKEYHGPRGG